MKSVQRTRGNYDSGEQSLRAYLLPSFVTGCCEHTVPHAGQHTEVHPGGVLAHLLGAACLGALIVEGYRNRPAALCAAPHARLPFWEH